MIEIRDRTRGYTILDEFFPLIEREFTGLELQRMLSKVQHKGQGISNLLDWSLPMEAIQLNIRDAIRKSANDSLASTKRSLLMRLEIPQLKEALHNLNHRSGVSSLMADRDSCQALLSSLHPMLSNSSALASVSEFIEDAKWLTLRDSMRADMFTRPTASLIDRDIIEREVATLNSRIYTLTTQIDELNSSHKEAVFLSKELLSSLGVPT